MVDSNSSKPTVTSRPSARSFMIENLVDEVSRGRIRVPYFQRGIRWDAGDVRSLLDSVRRGFPIGTFLLWKRTSPAEAQVFKLGSVTIDAPQSAEALWVVDGQQRITALTSTLLHPQPDYARSPDDFEFYFDLERNDFVRRALRRLPLPTWLPMWEILDSARLLKWLRGHNSLPSEAEACAIDLGKAFREYQVPAIIVESDSEKVLREIFERTNSAGRRLTQDEIFHALHAGQPGDEPGGLDEMAEALAELGFGDARELPLRQSVLAVRNIDPTRSFRDLGDRRPGQGALSDATLALRRVIVFLKRDARIPHVSLLPYSAPVIPLVRFFHLFPEPRPRSRELLARWLWRTAVAGTFHGGGPAVRRSLRAVHDKSEEQSVQSLLKLVGPSRPQFNPSPRFNLRTAESRLAALSLLAMDVVSLETGAPLNVNALLLERGTELFARAIINRPLNTRLDLSSIANRFIHNGKEGAPLLRLLQSAAREHPERLQGHGVPPAARAALTAGRWDDFFNLRAQDLLTQVSRYVSTRTRWGETDRPSLTSIIAEAVE
jgi:hypothetical protein